MAWHSSNCSQQDEDNAWKVIQDNETLVMDYIKTWKGKMILNILPVVYKNSLIAPAYESDLPIEMSNTFTIILNHTKPLRSLYWQKALMTKR